MGKIWTYEEARSVLTEVIQLTGDYHYYISELNREIKDKIVPEIEQERKEEEIHKLVVEWSNTLLDMEIEVKGLWLVDFDHGNGYYCWHFGEEDLLYEHGYDEGFKGRRLIEEREND